MINGETVQVFATAATALATVALVYVTWVLSRETKRLSAATNQPLVTATIEPNEWSMMHMDLDLENSGNAPAFDVLVTTDPEIGQGKPSAKGGRGMKQIDVLRTGQTISSFVAEAGEVLENSYKVEISWKRSPSSKIRESISYNHDVTKFKQFSRLGPRSPLHQIAEQLKKSRDDWKSIATGQKNIKADVFDDVSREKAKARMEKFRQEKESREND